ncbi:hypothetical protein KP78_13520 [Jeotgalibacillus soli]|uniref:EamA domain-containing protein n=2 Tax=Jeotgalibacillus soli TaxID=889306 RepID=A0A0C2S784_9BACL|nr:hypothetical protein KP78_13520 [Jeotgalibacillus soli]
MIIAFRFGELSKLHPFLSVGYILSTFFGYFFLQEEIGLMSLTGIAFIMVGVTLIGGDSSK